MTDPDTLLALAFVFLMTVLLTGACAVLCNWPPIGWLPWEDEK